MKHFLKQKHKTLYKSGKLFKFQDGGGKLKSSLENLGPPELPSFCHCSWDPYLTQDLTSNSMRLYKNHIVIFPGRACWNLFLKVSRLWPPGVIDVLGSSMAVQQGTFWPSHPRLSPQPLFTASICRLPFPNAPVNAEHQILNCFQSFCCKDVIWLLPWFVHCRGSQTNFLNFAFGNLNTISHSVPLLGFLS